jgi:hypothetical protein
VGVTDDAALLLATATLLYEEAGRYLMGKQSTAPAPKKDEGV